MADQLSKQPLRIGVIAGDGIGPEVVEQGLRVLHAVAAIESIDVGLRSFPHGAEHHLATGELAPHGMLEELAELDAIFGSPGMSVGRPGC